MTSDNLPQALEQDVLTILCWSDRYIPLVVNSVSLDLFSEDYREIAKVAFDFYDNYKKPIGVHLDSELQSQIEGKKGDIYTETIQDIFENKDQITEEYVKDKLTAFLDTKTFVNGLMKAFPLAKNGKIEQAKAIMDKVTIIRTELFDPGTRFARDLSRTFAFMNRKLEDEFITGIPEFDRVRVVPARKKLLVVLAEPKTGKTWYIYQLAKMAVIKGQKVLIITFEVPEEDASQRFVMSFFSVAESQAAFMERNSYIKFRTNDKGRLRGLEEIEIDERAVKYFNNPKHYKKIYSKAEKYSRRLDGLVIKEFPRGTKTVKQIEGFMDGLERFENFVPDLLLIDYPELLNLSADNYRIALGRSIVDIIGVAASRNMACAVPYQGNRKGLNKNVLWLTGEHMSEDFSPFKHADKLVSLNATELEKQMGIVRLYNFASRDGNDGYKVVCSNNFGIGQFRLTSAYINDKDYGRHFKELTGEPLVKDERRKK